MIRARFKTREPDFRPVNWPITHPWWCTGYGGEGDGEYAVIVAYADDEAELLGNWPEAEDIDSTPETEYAFSGRFPKPEWMADVAPEIIAKVKGGEHGAA